MIDFESYVDYFKGLAEKHSDINPSPDYKAFFRLNIDELLTGLRSDIDPNSFVMVLESYEHSPIDNLSENHLSNFTGAFMIIKKNEEISDFDNQDVIITECEKICVEIQRRIYDESINDYANRFFTDINPSDFTFNKVGPLYNSWFGFRCQFNFTSTYSIKVDAGKWTDL